MKKKSRNIYRRLADLVAFCHITWVLIAIILVIAAIILGEGVGSQLIFFIIWAMLFTILLAQTLFSGCPLTHLENSLRKKYNPKTSTDPSFIGSFLKRHFNINLSPGIITLIIVILFIINSILCYQIIFYK